MICLCTLRQGKYHKTEKHSRERLLRSLNVGFELYSVGAAKAWRETTLLFQVQVLALKLLLLHKLSSVGDI